jgi:hypothetical protein
VDNADAATGPTNLADTILAARDAEDAQAAASPAGTATPDAESRDDAETDPSKLDMLALLERIRARYKLACSVLGVRPRLAAAGAESTSADDQPAARSAVVHGRTVDPDQLNF